MPQDPDKAKEKYRRYRKAHREELNERLRVSREIARREAGIPKRGKPWTPEDRKEWFREYQKAHPEKGRERTAKYRREHPERVKEQDKKQKAKRRQQILEYCRRKAKERWSAMSEEERIEENRLRRERYASNPEKSKESTRMKSIRRRAKQMAASGEFTAEDVNQLFVTQKKKCATCKSRLHEEGKNRFHIDHVMPLHLGGSNDPSNLQLLCPKCNLKKGHKHPEEWARQNGLLFV